MEEDWFASAIYFLSFLSPLSRDLWEWLAVACALVLELASAWALPDLPCCFASALALVLLLVSALAEFPPTEASMLVWVFKPTVLWLS